MATALKSGTPGKYFQVDPFNDGNYRLCQAGAYDYEVKKSGAIYHIKIYPLNRNSTFLVDCPLSALFNGDSGVAFNIDTFNEWMSANFFSKAGSDGVNADWTADAGPAKLINKPDIETIDGSAGSGDATIGFAPTILIAQNGDIVRDGNNYTATAAASSAIGTQSLAAGHDGAVFSTKIGDSKNAVLSFETFPDPITAATQLTHGYTFFANILYVWDNGAAISKGVVAHQYYRLSRTGDVISLHGSNNRQVWDFLHTFSVTTSAQMYLRAFLVNDGNGLPSLTDVRGLLTANTLAIGDSTVAAYLGQNAVADYLYNATDTSAGYKITSLAVPGNTIAQQKAAYLAYGTPGSIDAVIVEIGLNDLNPAVPLAATLAEYQDLIDTIRSGSRPGSQILLATMTPCKQRLVDVYTTTWNLAYQKWLDMNQAFNGEGGTPITGADYRFSDHTAALNDGNGNLQPQYDMGDHIHQNNAARQIIAGAWKSALNANNQYYDIDGTNVDRIRIAGSGARTEVGGDLYVSGRVKLFSLSIDDRDSLGGVSRGDTIYCTDAVANDTSIGVMQTYNGSAWKNHW